MSSPSSVPKPEAPQHSCGPLPERIFRTSFHWVVITLCNILFRITCKVRVVELAPVPRKGPLIMASNHISHFDPPILSGFFPRRLDWLAMEEMFRAPWSRKVFTALNCIPVDRSGSDRTSLRRALARLADKRVIGIFPEGGIRAGEDSILNSAPMKPGLAALSMHSGVAVLPCLVIGSDRLYNKNNWLRRTQLILLFGEAIHPPAKQGATSESKEQFARQLAEAFPRLREEAVTRFQLQPHDLPQTPQARKGEHP